MTIPGAIERNAKVIQLVVSTFNAVMLATGLLWAFSQFYGDSKFTDAAQAGQIHKLIVRVEKIESAMFGTIRDGQEKTNARLTTLETQNVFIMRSLDRLEAGLSKLPPPK